ncbi:unnamed protein product [Adineta ricciae]|uniref:Major facilitator superfamily (MFS) profile domain-containing protein n=1 Tax=Adineta ricciae TaxID=249248 RepID=A0A814M8H2_ADIRI|nr:unnamed protein product [Adineta ricciae]CAF1347481.1 unnamed protein product [Adineta ricciae]
MSILYNSQKYTTSVEEKKLQSIYETYDQFQKLLILFNICALAIFSVFDELVYLPALPETIKDFNTTETMGLLTISMYLFGLALSSLLWGALSDYYGRKPIMIFALVCLIFSGLGCYLSPNIYVFIIFRALQGCLVSASVVVAQGTIADVYDQNHRGEIYGIFYGCSSLSGLTGPVFGGEISQRYGWRSTFIFTTILVTVLLIIYVLSVPETHQYMVTRKYLDEKGVKLLECDQSQEPKLINPCLPLCYLNHCSILPYLLPLVAGMLAFKCCSVMLTTTMSLPPYSLSESAVGMLYIPLGIAYLLGSVVGGDLADYVARRSFRISKILEGRMIPGLLLSLTTIIGLLLFGWTIGKVPHAIIPLTGQVLAVFGGSTTRPGILSYLTSKYQENSGSVSSLAYSFQYLVASIVVSFIAPTIEIIHSGPFFTILAIVSLSTTIIAFVSIYEKFRSDQNSEMQSLL